LNVSFAPAAGWRQRHSQVWRQQPRTAPYEHFFPAMINSSRIKSSIRVAKGMIGYFRFPEQRAEWNGPFNGQKLRVGIFRELHRTYRFATLFETGSYRGSTTEFLAAETGAMVRTVELEPWSYGFCRARFLWHPRIRVELGDSRKILKHLVCGGSGPSFFYLDAHWGEDLPLSEEIDQIFRRWNDAVIMIDDFRVPDDAHYGFDHYGTDKELALDYVLPAVRRFQARVYFPAAPGLEESGARRGCVVLIGREVPLPAQSFRTLRKYRDLQCA
jgi:hypothetical protein